MFELISGTADRFQHNSAVIGDARAVAWLYFRDEGPLPDYLTRNARDCLGRDDPRRERFTRTLLVHTGHQIERNGPYRFIRHPGYFGSLLCLNGIGLASGNTLVVVASILEEVYDRLQVEKAQ